MGRGNEWMVFPNFLQLIRSHGWTFAVLGGAVGALSIFLTPPSALIEKGDFAQDYLGSTLLLAGSCPYVETVPNLVFLSGSEPDDSVNPHPTPHTPLLLGLAAPLASIPLEDALIGWRLFNTLAITLAIGLVVTRLLGGTARDALLLTGLVHLLPPAVSNLGFGSYGGLIALALAVSLTARREAVVGGGLAILWALRLAGAPFFIFLLLTRRWSAVAATASISVILWLGSLLLLQTTCLSQWVLEVLPQISGTWSCALNNSSFSGALHLISGNTPYLISAGQAELVTCRTTPWWSFLGTLAILVGGTFAAWRLHLRQGQPIEVALRLALLTVMAQPIAWLHSYVAALPFVIGTGWLLMREAVKFSRVGWFVAGGLAGIFFIDRQGFLTMMLSFTSSSEAEIMWVHPLIGSILALPTLLIALASLTSRSWLEVNLETAEAVARKSKKPSVSGRL